MEVIKVFKLDNLTMKPHIKMYLFVTVFLGFVVLTGSSIKILLFTAAWYSTLIATNIFAVQEQHDMDRLYGVLSIRTKSLILGRYLYVTSYYFAASAWVILFSVVLDQFNLLRNGMDFEHFLLSLTVSFFLFSAITSGQLPLLFKMGYTKGRMISMVPFLLVIGVTALATFSDPLNMIKWILANEMVSVVIFLGLGFLFMTISYWISILIKESQK